MKFTVKSAHLQTPCRVAAGFTLIEMVAVITILAIVSLGITNFIGNTTQIYVNSAERDDVLAKSRYTVERLNRAIRYALPNSLRVATHALNPSDPNSTVISHCLEYFPIEWSTFYLNLSASNPADPSADPMLEGPDMVSALRRDSDYDASQAGNHYAVVYPTSPEQIYVTSAQLNSASDGRITRIASVSNANADGIRQVRLQRRFNFTEESTVERFYIVSDPVSFCLADVGGSYSLFLLRGYPIQATQIADVNQLVNLGATRILMAENLKNDIRQIRDLQAPTVALDQAPFRVDDSNLKRNSIVHTLLMFERNEEVVVFNNEIHLRNSP